MAVEENYWAEASPGRWSTDFLPSGLVPNQDAVLDQFQHVPTSIAFQSTAFPARRLQQGHGAAASRRSRTSPTRGSRARSPCRRRGDITAGGFLLGLAAELGKDYKDPAQMKEVVDWVDRPTSDPNVLKYTTRLSPRLQQLLESGAVDAVASGTASPASSTSAARRTPPCWCPQTSIPATATCGSPRVRRTRCWPRSSSTGGWPRTSSSPTPGRSSTGRGAS